MNNRSVKSSPVKNGSVLSAEMNAEVLKLFKSDGPQPDEAAVLIKRDLIEPNPAQPRKRFDPKTLHEIGMSMRENGQLQECIVRPHPTLPGRYQLIAGERRWRATAPEYGGIAQLRCVVRDVDDATALVFAIEENAKREDINPVERAQALVSLKSLNFDVVSPGRQSPQHDVDGADKGAGKGVTAKGMTWEEVGNKVGLTRAAVDRLVQLLKLPEPVLEKFQQLDLNEKHGRGLLMLKEDLRAQAKLLREIEEQQLSGNQALNRAAEISAGIRAAGLPSVGDGASRDSRDGRAQSDISTNRSTIGTAITPETPTQPSATQLSGQSSNQKSPERIDPLLAALKPATAHLTEGKRLLSTLKLSADYRRSIRRELDLAQSQIDDLRKLVK